MATYTVAAVEDGLESPVTVYAAGASPMALTPTGWVGLRFTGLPYDTFSAVGRTQASSTLKSIALSLRVNPSAPTLGTLTVGFVDEVDPAVFSGVNLPSSKVTTTVGTITFSSTGDQAASIPFTSGLATLYRRHRQISSAPPSTGWQGKFAFVLTYTGTSVSITSGEAGADQPTLVTEELPYVTGITRYHRAHSRVDRCPRCGRLQPRELFVKDGFVRNLLVCQRCYDEPDLVHKTGIRPGREKPGINQ